MTEYLLKNKVALVTGAASGLGYETARQLYARGARVALVDLDHRGAAQAAASLGGRAISVAGDVSDEDEIEAIIATVLERLGRLDVAVANAGTNANPLSVSLTVEAALPHVLANGGRVVMVAPRDADLEQYGSALGVSHPQLGAFVRVWDSRRFAQLTSVVAAAAIVEGVECQARQP